MGVFPKHGNVVPDGVLDLVGLNRMALAIAIQGVADGQDVISAGLVLVPESFRLGVHLTALLLGNLDEENVLFLDVVVFIGKFSGETDPRLEELNRRALSVFQLLSSLLEVIEELPDQTVLVSKRFQRFHAHIPLLEVPLFGDRSVTPTSLSTAAVCRLASKDL